MTTSIPLRMVWGYDRFILSQADGKCKRFLLFFAKKFFVERGNSQGNAVRAAKITLRLHLQIGKGIDFQIVIKAFRIVSAASPNLAVVSGGVG